jgi:hypothetical protein
MKTKNLLILSMFVCVHAIHANQITLHQPPEGVEKAPDFRVMVNGEETFVYNTPHFAFTQFDFEGEAEIEIYPTQDVKWVDIRPKSDEISFVSTSDKIGFILYNPVQLSIELNGENERPLYILANPPEVLIPDKNDDNVVFFEGGKVYDVKHYKLKSNQHIYIEGGAIVKGMFDLKNLENVKISGRGIIDGTDNDELELPRLIKMDHSSNIEVSGITLLNSLRWTIQPSDCNNVLFDNVKILNWDTGSDGIDVCSSNNVMVKNSFLRCNDDCIVIKAPGERSYYPDPKPLGNDASEILVENCVLWNMAWGNAIEIGFELRSEIVENIVFKDIDVINVDRGAVLSIHNGDYATVRNVTYEDIRVENAQHKLIDLAIFLSQYSYDRPDEDDYRSRYYLHGAWDGVQRIREGKREFHAQYRGHIKNITFRNVRVVDGPVPFSIISGFDEEHQVENVWIENLQFHSEMVNNREEGKFFIQHAEEIEFE